MISGGILRKIERIRTDIDSIHLHPQDQDLVPSDGVTNRTLNSFNNLSERNVSDLINNSAKEVLCPGSDAHLSNL